MQPVTRGFDEWTQRGALLMGLGLWTAGFAVGGAAAWQMHRGSSPLDWAGHLQKTDMRAEDNASAMDTSESEGAAFMPEDTIVGRTEPGIGMTQMQNR
jgi:hypothetical protein